MTKKKQNRRTPFSLFGLLERFLKISLLYAGVAVRISTLPFPTKVDLTGNSFVFLLSPAPLLPTKLSIRQGRSNRLQSIHHGPEFILLYL